MDDIGSLPLPIIILIIFVLLAFSALFSGAETAFFSLTKLHLNKLEKENNSRAKRIINLLKKPKQLLIAILLGNTIVNITATSIATLFMLELAKKANYNTSLLMTAMVIVMTALILVFGEVIPKLYAFSSPIKVSGFTSFLLIPFKFICFPVILILEWFTTKISKKKDFTPTNQASLSHEDIRNIVSSETSNHPLEENEKRIIDSIFRFSSTEAKEVMVPRVDIIGIEATATIDEAKQVVVNSGHSRIPVYKKSLDEIVGIIYAKDLILHPEKTSIQALQRRVFFVPENMKIQTLMTQFQNRKKQIAIVVDEYGGTSGLVTLEDILEELVGEIMDEYDDEQPMITKYNDTNYLVSGMMQISELNREFDLNLDEEFDNLAEFLYSELNHIPHKNEKVTIENSVEFTISHLKKQRIDYVKMRLLSPQTSDDRPQKADSKK